METEGSTPLVRKSTRAWVRSRLYNLSVDPVKSILVLKFCLLTLAFQDSFPSECCILRHGFGLSRKAALYSVRKQINHTVGQPSDQLLTETTNPMDGEVRARKVSPFLPSAVLIFFHPHLAWVIFPKLLVANEDYQ
jgi:hypothetical protein